MSENSVSASLEDYLEAIYFLNGQTEDVRVTDLAAELGISKPSVNRAVNTLKDRGYVEHEYYGGLRLTREGLDIAMAVAKRHFMLKRFFTDMLGVDEAVAEKEACAVEHSISHETIEKLEGLMRRMNEGGAGE